MAKRKSHRRRKTSRALNVGGKTVRRRKRRGLSEGGFKSLMKPDLKSNPLVGGAVGGAGARVIQGFIPKSVTEAMGKDGKPTMIAKFAKPLAIAGAGVVAQQMKQPLVAAACFGVAVFTAMGAAGMLADDMADSFFQTQRYADPNLLNEDIAFYDDASGQYISLSDAEALQMAGLEDTMLLSDNLYEEESPYPNYSMLNDTMLLSDDAYQTYQLVD